MRQAAGASTAFAPSAGATSASAAVPVPLCEIAIRRAVRLVLADIRKWLAPVLEGEDPPLKWEDLTVVIAEGDREVYRAPGARLIGRRGRFVEIVPKARHVFNAMGRVDFVSRRGRAILARFGERNWSFVWPSDPDGAWRSVELNPATLAEVVQEMLA